MNICLDKKDFCFFNPMDYIQHFIFLFFKSYFIDFSLFSSVFYNYSLYFTKLSFSKNNYSLYFTKLPSVFKITTVYISYAFIAEKITTFSISDFFSCFENNYSLYFKFHSQYYKWLQFIFLICF